jgi:DNA-directed RNA polymerase subunit M/transcription elongation factor TFIIS
MAIDLEVKHRLRELEARIKALEDRQKPEAYMPAPVVTLKTSAEVEKEKKLCPKCGVKPAYFFHVRSCAAKNSRAGG